MVIHLRWRCVFAGGCRSAIVYGCEHKSLMFFYKSCFQFGLFSSTKGIYRVYSLANWTVDRFHQWCTSMLTLCSQPMYHTVLIKTGFIYGEMHSPVLRGNTAVHSSILECTGIDSGVMLINFNTSSHSFSPKHGSIPDNESSFRIESEESSFSSTQMACLLFFYHAL